MKKTTTTKLINLIRKRFESGEDLIDLALEYKISYGTLRNISSKEKWEKGILKDLLYLKGIEKETQEIIKEKDKRKKEYKDLTKLIRKDLKEMANLSVHDYVIEEKTSKSLAESKAIVLNLKIKTIKEAWDIDKELFQITTLSEEQDLKLKQLKYQELKKKAGLIDRLEEDEDILVD